MKRKNKKSSLISSEAAAVRLFLKIANLDTFPEEKGFMLMTFAKIIEGKADISKTCFYYPEAMELKPELQLAIIRSASARKAVLRRRQAAEARAAAKAAAEAKADEEKAAAEARAAAELAAKAEVPDSRATDGKAEVADRQSDTTDLRAASAPDREKLLLVKTESLAKFIDKHGLEFRRRDHFNAAPHRENFLKQV